MNHWFPWILAAGNVSSIMLTTRGKVLGFVVLIPTQVAFIAYALATDQAGFILQNIVMTAVAVYGVRRWLREGVHRDGSRAKAEVGGPDITRMD